MYAQVLTREKVIMSMTSYSRMLNTDIQVEHFVDHILKIEDKKQKRKAINIIAAAERNMQDYSQSPTLTHWDYRDTFYRDDEKREKLRKRIFDELKEKERLSSDDRIKLGRGGAKPHTALKKERKVFYLIGPPASGKSTIASQIADIAGAYILDSDYAKRKLPEYRNQISAASLIHDESAALVFSYKGYNLLAYCVENEYNMVIPKIGHDKDKIIKFACALKESGYKVYLISIDLDRAEATKRAYVRFVKSKRYVPLSLVFDCYANEPTLNYFKIRQLESDIFDGFAQISTDVSRGTQPLLLENIGIEEIDEFYGRI